MREVELYQNDNYIDFDNTVHYENIRFGDYFRSLVSEAIRCGIFEKSFSNGVKYELGELLKTKIHEFTEGESTSVMQDTANGLFMSILFTIDVRLLQEESHEKAIDVIADNSVSELFVQGSKLVKRLKNECVGLLVKARKTRIYIEDTDYNNLLDFEIFNIIKKYNESLFSHVASRNINYHSVLGTGSLRGIYYTKKLIENIIFENEFLRNFDEEKIRDICFEFCRARNSDYNKIGTNIFSLVLKTRLLSHLAGNNDLLLTSEDLSKVNRFLRRQNEEIQKETLLLASKELWNDEYVEKCMHKIIPKITEAIRNNTLKRVVATGVF